MLFVEVKKNKNKEGTHSELCIDLGYRKAVLSFDRALCAELADMTVKELLEKPAGTIIKIKEK